MGIIFEKMKILYLFYVHIVIAQYDNPLECNGNKRLDQYVCDKDLPTGGQFGDTNDSLFEYIKHVYLINSYNKESNINRVRCQSTSYGDDTKKSFYCTISYTKRAWNGKMKSCTAAVDIIKYRSRGKRSIQIKDLVTSCR